MGSLIEDRRPGGFCFDNYARNLMLEKQSSVAPPKARKTGTTICGVVYKDGVVLAADQRATSGNVIVVKDCNKVHYIADNIYCCGAGTAADTDQVTRMVSSQMELGRLNTMRTPRVIASLRLLKQYLFKYQGHVGAALVLGGVDATGPHLYGVHPHGSSDKVPYLTMGSGMIAAMSVLESNFKPNMTKDEAMKLCRDAIAAGIFHDLGSGSSINMVVITKEGSKCHFPYEICNAKDTHVGDYFPKPGTTAILKQKVKKVEYDVVSTRVIRDIPQEEAMEVN